MTPAERQEYIGWFKDVLCTHQRETEGHTFGTNAWLHALTGNIYVRPFALHNLGDLGTFTSYDFANVRVKSHLQGHGLLTDAIEWWHTQHTQQMTYIENVTNERFANSLRKRGWSEITQWEQISFYRLR